MDPVPPPSDVTGAREPSAVTDVASQTTINGDSNWKTQISDAARRRIIAKMMEDFIKIVPLSKEELSSNRDLLLHEFEKIATEFEEKVYNVAISQTDYVRKIAIKMLSFKKKVAEEQSNVTNTSQTHPD